VSGLPCRQYIRFRFPNEICTRTIHCGQEKCYNLSLNRFFQSEMANCKDHASQQYGADLKKPTWGTLTFLLLKEILVTWDSFGLFYQLYFQFSLKHPFGRVESRVLVATRSNAVANAIFSQLKTLQFCVACANFYVARRFTYSAIRSYQFANTHF